MAGVQAFEHVEGLGPPDLAEAVDLIVFLAGRGTSRRVKSLIEVQGLDAGGDYLLKPLVPPVLHVV